MGYVQIVKSERHFIAMIASWCLLGRLKYYDKHDSDSKVTIARRKNKYKDLSCASQNRVNGWIKNIWAGNGIFLVFNGYLFHAAVGGKSYLILKLFQGHAVYFRFLSLQRLLLGVWRGLSRNTNVLIYLQNRNKTQDALRQRHTSHWLLSFHIVRLIHRKITENYIGPSKTLKKKKKNNEWKL